MYGLGMRQKFVQKPGWILVLPLSTHCVLNAVASVCSLLYVNAFANVHSLLCVERCCQCPLTVCWTLLPVSTHCCMLNAVARSTHCSVLNVFASVVCWMLLPVSTHCCVLNAVANVHSLLYVEHCCQCALTAECWTLLPVSTQCWMLLPVSMHSCMLTLLPVSTHCMLNTVASVHSLLCVEGCC